MRSQSWVVALACAVSLSLALAACKGGDNTRRGEMKSGDENAPIPVETVVLGAGPIEDTIRLSSTLRAETQIQVLARAAGQVRARNFEEGDQVKRNAVMMRIEAAEQSAAIRRIDNDLAQARRNLERERKGQTDGVSTKELLERAQFEVERLALMRKDASRSYGYTVVRSPIAGTVTQRFVKYGDVVVPNQPLYEIVDFDSIVAEVFVPERDIARVAVGAVARLSSPASGTSLPTAKVQRIAPVVDPRSGTIKVTLELPDGDDPGQEPAAMLRPGMFVDVHVVTAYEPDALLLPRRALIYDNDEPFAFKMVGDENVEKVRVVAAIEDRDYIKPKSGFAAGDRVVVAGQVGLKDGALVKASALPDSAAAASGAAEGGAAAATDKRAQTQPAADAGAKNQ